MEDDFTHNGRRPHPKWKMTSPKMEDDLTQMEDDQQVRSTVDTGVLYPRVRDFFNSKL